MGTVHGGPARGTGSQGSQLLASLPSRDLDTLRRDLERIRLDAERAIMHAHAPVRRVYFPESGLVALSVTMADGRTAGVTIVGSDGIVGLAAAFGDAGPMDATVLVPGIAQSISADRFRAACRDSEALRRMVGTYAIALLRHLAQTVACNRLHSLDQRAARWLLLARDRIGSDTLPADPGGVRRPARRVAAGRLDRRRAVRPRGRGRVPAGHRPHPRRRAPREGELRVPGRGPRGARAGQGAERSTRSIGCPGTCPGPRWA